MTNDQKCVFFLTVLFLSSYLLAGETCPVEVKLLLSPLAIQTVTTSFRFDHETAGQVYFFDTADLDLLRQGAIIRVRQGAGNDLTVKVRVAESSAHGDAPQLHGQFPCERDRTGAEQNTSYSVQRKYKTLHVPEMGTDIVTLLSLPQQKLLREARVSIDWARVTRIASIRSTKWETTTQSPFRKLVLELWEWPAGSALELSTKVGPDAGQSAYGDLQKAVAMRSLSLSAIQGTKTRMVLEALAQRTSSPR
jgi:hypothetical protein